MKNPKFWLGAAVLSATLVLPLGVEVIAAPTAPTFTSKSEGFAVWLPAKPQVSQQSKQVPRFGTLTAKTYSVAKPPLVFIVMPMNLPGTLTAASNKQFLDGVQRGFTMSAKAKLVSAQNISLNGIPGRELIVNVGPSRVRGRFFGVGKKAYQVLVVYPQTGAGSKSPQDHQSLGFLSDFALKSTNETHNLTWYQ